ncbi:MULTISPECIES: CgeB family protein [Bacillaceae]|uniref:CgeB family protein n=1 Tax=Bacillaceae TaxID=186817 RepID=UPI001A8DE244|nr:glycosyltransferase [Bacillus sp. NTK034]MBN8201204.1 glycosyltransferase [Bacillus sp. NTK034]
MRILFISSGYTGIYKFFEQWIMKELQKKTNVKQFDPLTGIGKLKTMVNQFKPDIVIVLLGFKVPLKIIQWVKTQKIKTAVWLTEDPYYMDKTEVLIPNYDYIFTIDTAAKDFYIKKGHQQTFHLPLGTSTEIFKPIQAGPAFISDICLLGYPYPDRVKLIQVLLEKTPYKIKVIGKWRNKLIRLQNHPRLRIHDIWVEPSIAAQYYNGAKIVLNTHRPYNLHQNKNRIGIKGNSINNRTFDVAACGAFQLIEYKEDLPIHFIEDKEIVSFKTEDELLQKIIFYINHEEKRKEISELANKRVLKEHTFEKRMEDMLSKLQ